MKKGIFFVASLAIASANFAQQFSVPKTYTKPVLMHYMPWFETPEFDGGWGYHWTMNNNNPNTVVNATTGERDIASHYNPLIGPYSSIDPAVLEYHLLLMKYAGVDGILIDWYGQYGGNGDIGKLLQASNAIVDVTDDAGMEFGVVLEDRFSQSRTDVERNVAYLRDNYFNRSNYYRHGAAQDPILAIFGPINYTGQSTWDQIVQFGGEDMEILPLWNDSDECGSHGDGNYTWPQENEALDNWYTLLRDHYDNEAPNLKTFMGSAYTGFDDYYAEAGQGAGYFTIPHEDGVTLEKTFGLADEFKADIDILQLVTWNDYGEGTMFEPTLEFGYQFLTQLQSFLGVSYTLHELEQVHRLYTLRKSKAGDITAQAKLDQVFDAFADLQPALAEQLMDEVEGIDNGGNNDPIYYHIVNRWWGTYLCQDGSVLGYEEAPMSGACVWSFESVSGGNTEIKNYATDQYINIENEEDWVEVSDRNPEWWSSRWTIQANNEGFYTMENAWQPDNYINLEYDLGYAEWSDIDLGWHSPQWKFEPVVVTQNSEALSPPDNIDIYPVPFNNELHVSASEQMVSQEIVDITGRTVLRADTPQKVRHWKVNHLAPGVYTLKVEFSDGSSAVKKLVKQ